MVKQNLLTKLLLLFALIVGSTSVWADDVTIATATFDGKAETYTEGWTVTGTGKSSNKYVCIGYGESITSPSFNLTKYSSVTITITARRVGNLTGSKATINASIGSTPLGNVDATSNASTLPTLEGITFSPTSSMNEAVIVFTCTNATGPGSSHGAGIGKIDITGVSKSTGTLESIVISGDYPTSFYVGDVFSHTGMTVTANYSDEFTADVTDDAIFTGYDMTTAGAQTVTVSYTDNNVTKTANYGITVSERPKFTVTLADDGTELVEAAGGAGVTLPSRTDLGSYTFAGWSETEIMTEVATATIIPAGAYNPAEDITLYPIYRKSKTAEHSVNIGTYATANNWTTTSGSGQYYSVELDDDVTASVSQTGNNGKVYTNNDVVNWRLYNGGTLTITSKTGNIVSVLFNTQDTSFGIKYGETALSRGVLFTVNGGKNVSFSVTTTTRITDIEVVTSSYTYISVPVASITVTSAGYATFSSAEAVDFSANEGLTVFTAKDNGTSVTLNEVTSKKVPANTAVVLKGAEGSYEGTVIASAKALTDNDLKIAEEDLHGNGKIYVLNKKNDKVGFYKLSTTGTLEKGKAYLETENAAPFLGFDGDDTTGIYSVERGALSVEGCYTLDGRRVAQPTKGLYIVNGKKVLIP